MKICAKCRITKSEIAFSKQNGKLKSYCKICCSALHKEYLANQRENNPEFYEQNRTRQTLARQNNKKMRVGLIFNNIRHHAKTRNKEFSLTQDMLFFLFEIQNWRCRQTGVPLDLTTGKGKRPFGPTVDRIDNAKGYEIANIQIVCNIYNMAKNEFAPDDVLQFARALLTYKGEIR